jgi:hypothetical protein
MKVYPGFWEGKVVSISAPATERVGSVRVRIPAIHGAATDVPDTSLPWARPNFLFAGALCGVVGVPPVQAQVNVIFKHGDKNFPMWIGGGYLTGTEPVDFAAAKQGLDPKGYMWVTPGGYAIVMNEVLKTVEVKTPNPSLTGIKIDLTAKKVSVTADSTPGTPFEMTLDETLKKAELKTATGYLMALDETLKKASLETPTGYKVELDETTQAAKVTTPSAQSMVLNDAAGEVTLTGTAKGIITGILVELGLGATQSILIGELFATFFDAHIHPTSSPGAPTGVPVAPLSLALAGLSSQTVKIRP